MAAETLDQLRADFALVWKTRYDRGDEGVPRVLVMAGRKVVGLRPDTSKRDDEAARIKRMTEMGDASGLSERARVYAELAAPIRADLARSERIRAEVRAERGEA